MRKLLLATLSCVPKSGLVDPWLKALVQVPLELEVPEVVGPLQASLPQDGPLKSPAPMSAICVLPAPRSQGFARVGVPNHRIL